MDKPDNIEAPRPVRRRRWWLWALALALIAGIGVWYAWAGPRARVSPPAQNGGAAARGGGRRGAGGRAGMPIPVAVITARRGDMPVYQDGLGNVSAFYTVTVHTRVDGQLMSVPVREGEMVRQGQMIAQVDPRPFQVQLEQAQGQMAHDQALLANAKLDMARYKTLLDEDAIPRQQYDTQVATVAQYEGNIKQDQAAIDNARLQLTYARVTAPITGRVGIRLVDPGNIVHASDSTGLFVITQIQPIAALFTIAEDNLQPVLRRLRAGATLRAEAWNRDKSKQLAVGRVLTVDNQIDPTTGTTRLKAVYDNRDGALFPNQFVNIRLLVDTLHGQVIIPEAAVQRGAEGTFVYVVTPQNKAQVRKVNTGITEANNVTVRSGVNAGDRVVIDGAEKLQNGSEVRIRPVGAGPAQPAGDESGAGGPAS